jgi:UDPglucose--hexose-1-phosphate uridylyltransferase
VSSAPNSVTSPGVSPHRRKNILTGDWVLVSPHRTQRPWQGEVSAVADAGRNAYDPACYLCPGNPRAGGHVNPRFTGTFAFTNDFPALEPPAGEKVRRSDGLLIARSERGICRVVVYSERHDLTLADMTADDIERVVALWQAEMATLGADPTINYVTIFENKGSMMGNSNPHPHCQIWAQESVPVEPAKETASQKRYHARMGKSLLGDYLRAEMKDGERIVSENRSFVTLVPFWAVWPYEAMIIPRRVVPHIRALTSAERKDFASSLKTIAAKYDNLFSTPFPYSSGLHQAPTDGKRHPEWHLHVHFFPPLLRSATIKKHMVGYEMFAEPQRDITAEQAAKTLRALPTVPSRRRGMDEFPE